MLKQYGLIALGAVAILAGAGLQLAGSPWGVFGWTLGAVVASAGVVLNHARWGTLAAAVVAASANAYLLYLKVRSSSEPALCSVNEVIDCESINDSVYSAVFNGTTFETPITLLGFAFFTGLALAAAFVTEKGIGRFFQVSAFFSIVNVVVSLALASILVSEFKICIFCISIYLSNFVILGAAIMGLRKTGTPIGASLGGLVTDTSFLTIVGAFTALVIGGFTTGLAGNFEVDPERAIAQGQKVDLTKFYSPVPDGVELDGSEPKTGAEQPTYVVVEFADYMCPHCAEASRLMKGWMADQNDVQLIFKVFPLSSDCNPAIPNRPNPMTCLAAAYAECAGQQGRFWEINRDLYVNQGMLTQSGYNANDLDAIIENRGVNAELARQCAVDPEVMRGIQRDAIAGAKAGLEGTPAFYVQGITDDGSWVMAKRGAEDLMRLVTAHRAMKAKEAASEAPAPGTDG